MTHAAWIEMVKRAHRDWQLVLLKAGPGNTATKIFKKRLDLLLAAGAPRAPKMEGHA